MAFAPYPQEVAAAEFWDSDSSCPRPVHAVEYATDHLQGQGHR